MKVIKTMVFKNNEDFLVWQKEDFPNEKRITQIQPLFNGFGLDLETEENKMESGNSKSHGKVDSEYGIFVVYIEDLNNG